MKTVAIIQARMGSSRLPGKVLASLGEMRVLPLMVNRLRRAESLSMVAVATTMLSEDDEIVSVCEKLLVPVFRGSATNVLERYVSAAAEFTADVVVRLTADCPFICPEVTDEVVRAYFASTPRVDYASNCLRRTYPRGLDTEVVAAETLRRAAAEATDAADLEHVTYFIRRQPNRFRHFSVEDTADHSDLRWTLDTAEDLQLLLNLARSVGSRLTECSYRDLLKLVGDHPEWRSINCDVEQTRLAGIS